MSAVQNPDAEPRKVLATTRAIEPVPIEAGTPIDSSIGPYRLMEKIGEGGFGLVFVAEQQHPVKRKVALKVIKPGMDSREVIARFEAERQALALMDHPNIARVLDAGTTESGHPYFVMELVRGVPITDYCDKNRLTLRERLELFVTVCQAIQHAHQKGIIHRDIKPSNVLVTLHDSSPVAKVIDFGVAKALHEQLTDKTIYTRFAQVIGTPLYMSPEQAEMSGLDIDTRSDIYSLGVLLYELLTGTTPFDGKRLAQAPLHERIRIIREEEPPKPSTRLRQSTETLPGIAAQRRIEPARLSKMFRGDLDWITMQALDKDRTRRYPTASALAADVVHYLRDEPVDAIPPSTAYLIRKFARRNRTILATGMAFLALLVTGVVASTWFWLQEKSAHYVADQLRQKEYDQRVVAEAETRRADENAQRAATALDRSERSLYFSQIALAERNWQARNPKRAADMLAACREKFRDWEWSYLSRLTHSEVAVFAGDNAAFSPDGQCLAISEKDKDVAIQVRNARTGKVSMTLQGARPIPLLRSLVFSPDSHRLAAVCEDSQIWIWDLSDGRQPLQVRVQLSGETLKYPLDHPVGLAFSPNGKRIALAGVVGEKPNGAPEAADDLWVWDAYAGKELFKVPNTGRSVAFSPDGKHLAISSRGFISGTISPIGPVTEGIRILDADTGRVQTKFFPWKPKVIRNRDDCLITYSPDGKSLVSVRDDEIKLWDATTAKEVRTLSGHTAPIMGLSFSLDGKKLASASNDETVQIWDVEQGKSLLSFRGHVGTVAAVAFNSDSKFLVSIGEDRTVRIWSSTDQQGPRAFPGMLVVNNSVAFSPDGNYAACMIIPTIPVKDSQFDLVILDARSGRQLRRLRPVLPLGDDLVHASLAFSSDGRVLVSALEQEVQLWDVETGKERSRYVGLCDVRQRGLSLSPDGARLAFATPKHCVEVWDVNLRKQLASFCGHQGPVTTIAFSPDGERLASAGTDGTVQLWSAIGGHKIRDLKGTTEVRNGVVFSPEGKFLLASGSDNSVRIWNLADGSELPALLGHKAAVWSIAFNPSGTRLATTGGDNTVRLWTWPGREEVLSLPVKFASMPVGFTADGMKLFAAADFGMTVWDATPRGTLGQIQEPQ